MCTNFQKLMPVLILVPIYQSTLRHILGDWRLSICQDSRNVRMCLFGLIPIR